MESAPPPAGGINPTQPRQSPDFNSLNAPASQQPDAATGNLSEPAPGPNSPANTKQGMEAHPNPSVSDPSLAGQNPNAGAQQAEDPNSQNPIQNQEENRLPAQPKASADGADPPANNNPGSNAPESGVGNNPTNPGAFGMNSGMNSSAPSKKRPFESEASQPNFGAVDQQQAGFPPSKVPRLSSNMAPMASNTPMPLGQAPQQPTPAPQGAPPANIDKDLKNAALRYLNKVKSRFEHQKDVYNDFLDIMKEFQSRQLDTPGVIKKVSTLFMGETELILGFNDFLPDGYKITEEDIAKHYPPAAARQQQSKPKPKQPAAPRPQNNMKTPPELRYAQSYVSKIRKRFRNDREVYKKFLKLLQNYQEDQKSVKEVHDRVKDLFKGHPDLLIEFKQFLPDPPEADGSTTQKSRKASTAKPKRSVNRDGEDSHLKYKDEMEFFSQFKSKMEPQQWEDFTKLLNLYNNHILSAMELMLILRDLFAKPTRILNRVGRGAREEEKFEQPDLHNSLHKFVQMLCGGYVSVFEGKKAAPKNLHRPANTNSGGPSYMCRPQTTLAICSSRDEMCESVLNDQYSLNPLGSEQTAVLTNTHEILLFKAEDDRFELEMMIAKIEWAINKLEPIAEELSTLSRTEKQRYEVYDRLNIVVMRTIQKLYGEQGQTVVDWLYDCPGAAVPIILARLKQREGELKTIQHEQHKIWVDVYEKNYHKALDHRSYAFKTNDKKAIHTKAIIQQVKDTPMEFKYSMDQNLEDIGMWTVLKEVIRDIIGEDSVAVIDFWDNWLIPHLFPCKEAAAKEKKTRGQQQQGPKGKWFVYGNQNMVSVIRLHQLLHSRMTEAKTMALEQDCNHKDDGQSKLVGTPKEGTDKNENGNGPDSPAMICATPKPRQTGDPFQAFVSILLAVLRNQVDVTKYEDECRTLLGTYSYKLFTLDKLIPRFIKETNTLIQSEHWQSMKSGADKVESGALQPEEAKTQMVELLWHNCFEAEYTLATNTMKLSAVAMTEAKDTVPDLAFAAADILEQAEEDRVEKESGVDEDEEGNGNGENTTEQQDDHEGGGQDMDMDDAGASDDDEDIEDEGDADDADGNMDVDDAVGALVNATGNIEGDAESGDDAEEQDREDE